MRPGEPLRGKNLHHIGSRGAALRGSKFPSGLVIVLASAGARRGQPMPRECARLLGRPGVNQSLPANERAFSCAKFRYKIDYCSRGLSPLTAKNPGDFLRKRNCRLRLAAFRHAGGLRRRKNLLAVLWLESV